MEAILQDFNSKHFSLFADLNITNNGNGTITLLLEGVSDEIYPTPKDFDEYFKKQNEIN